MTPVKQTITDEPFPNCLQAVTASYFDLELERVPNFRLFKKEYWQAFCWFVWSLGYESTGYIDELPPDDGTYYIASVEFGDDYSYSHVVIWKDGKIIHDPGLSGVDYTDKVVGYYGIIKRPNE